MILELIFFRGMLDSLLNPDLPHLTLSI